MYVLLYFADTLILNWIYAPLAVDSSLVTYVLLKSDGGHTVLTLVLKPC